MAYVYYTPMALRAHVVRARKQSPPCILHFKQSLQTTHVEELLVLKNTMSLKIFHTLTLKLTLLVMKVCYAVLIKTATAQK